MQAVEISTEKSPGILAENYSEVLGLQSCLARCESNISIIPRLVKRIIRDDCWREWLTPEGQVICWSAADFRGFLTSKRPEGCETPLYVIERILKDTDVWEAYCKAIGGEKGGANNPYGCMGKPADGINRDNVTIDSLGDGDPPDTIPFDPTPPRPERKREYSREATTGNSVSYAVRRLGRERPDLLERVKAGEITPNAAMVVGGFRPKSITITDEPIAASRRLVKHFRGEGLRTLVRELANWAGIRIVETPDE